MIIFIGSILFQPPEDKQLLFDLTSIHFQRALLNRLCSNLGFVYEIAIKLNMLHYKLTIWRMIGSFAIFRVFKGLASNLNRLNKILLFCSYGCGTLLLVNFTNPIHFSSLRSTRKPPLDSPQIVQHRGLWRLRNRKGKWTPMQGVRSAQAYFPSSLDFRTDFSLNPRT